MKTTLTLLALTPSLLLAQGPLAPPPGAPAPTMKTLTQLAPRTAIESLPFTISTSGSYYFTQNFQFTATTGNAISITTDNVTLDLGGFTLSSTPAVNGTAISVSAGRNNITIKNGIIAGNTTVTIAGTPRVWVTTPAGFSIGVSSNSTVARSMTVEHLHVSGCRISGISAIYGSIAHSTAISNGATGIFANFGSVSSCIATLNASTGINATRSTITDCTANFNDTNGILTIFGSVTDCTANSNRVDGISALDSSVSNCIATSNGSSGISANGGTVTNSTSNSNGTSGISALEGTVTSCIANSNGTFGISADSGTVTSCIASGNVATGIVAASCSVTSCTAAGNNATSAANAYDLFASSTAVAFTKYGTSNTVATGTIFTGNKTP